MLDLYRKKKKKPIVSISYGEFVFEGGHYVTALREANKKSLIFWKGMEVNSLNEVMGETIFSYAKRLETMPLPTVELWVAQDLEAKRILCRGEEVRRENIIIAKPDHRWLLWDEVATPRIKNRKVVGVDYVKTIRNNSFSPERILEIYLETYGGPLDAEKAFCHPFELDEEELRKLSIETHILRLLLSNEHTAHLNASIPYSKRTRKRYMAQIEKSLAKRGYTLQDVAKTLWENHKKGVWRAPFVTSSDEDSDQGEEDDHKK